ncbi:MAG: peptide chain release factor 1 [Terrimicrobiaceae bacterium]|nr:peptide chain release factor 1 [Terrimicrobiaceae bacterium]
MEISQLVARARRRFEEIERNMAAGSFFDDPAQARSILRERGRLADILSKAADWERARLHLEEARQLAGAPDAGLAEMAAAEIAALESTLPQLEKALRAALLPPEPGEDRDAIVEIRAGTGGAEAALFAADLCRMYSRYAESEGLSSEILEASPSDLGGFKQVILRVSGERVFARLRYESGVHRVQRVPATEAQGRIHTSTATVAVMPEAEEVDVEIRPEDLRIEVCRASGPGGQGVNTTDSAVQILHIPTGKIVRCQDGRSQQQNKERALRILRSRLLEDKIREEQEKYSAHRRGLIGSAARVEKIRTYNFPQNRVTDHRIGLTLHSLEAFLDGAIGPMIEALASADLEQRLASAGAED